MKRLRDGDGLPGLLVELDLADLDDLAELVGVEPLAAAPATRLDLDALVDDRGERGLAARTSHG